MIDFEAGKQEVSPSFAYNSVDKINKAYLGHARLTKFAGGHCCWPTYYNPEWRDTDGLSIYDWMLQYSIGQDKQPPVTEEPPVTDSTPRTITRVVVEYSDGTQKTTE